jgi:hypothetical protein
MALVDARQKANDEFARALASTGRRLEDLWEYVDRRQDFTSVFHQVPRVTGVAGTAASFVLHVAGCMKRERRARFMLAGLGVPGETAK